MQEKIHLRRGQVRYGKEFCRFLETKIGHCPFFFFLVRVCLEFVYFAEIENFLLKVL